MLKRLFFGGKIEQEVIEKIKRHIKILCSACETFKTAIEERDKKMMLGVFDLEREGDIIRRNIICLLYTSPSPRDRTRSRMPSSA